DELAEAIRHWNEQRLSPEPPSQLEEILHGARRRRELQVPHMDSPPVARERRRRRRHRRDAVDLHSEPAEAAGDGEAAVMDLRYDDRKRNVHGLAFTRARAAA